MADWIDRIGCSRRLEALFRWARPRAARILHPMRPAMSARIERAVLRRLNPRSKWHLLPGLSAAEFFAALERDRIRHIVLRWSETLPHVPPGRDLNLLVHDEDRPKLQHWLSRWPLGTPVDAYAACGSDEFASNR